MRSRAALLFAVVATLACTSAAQARLRQCPDYGGPLKIDHITATNTTCGAAERLVKKYTSRRRVHIDGYTCRTKAAPDGGFITTCKARGLKVIGFHGLRGG